jgi:transcriptional regulator with XRE-family HTH domain
MPREEGSNNSLLPVLSEQKQRAVRLLVQDKLTDEKIAEACGVTRQTITNWKREPDFIAAMHEVAAEVAQALYDLPITHRRNRVVDLQTIRDKLMQVITERGMSPEMAGIAGGETGLLTRRMTKVGHGKETEYVWEYAVDVGMLKELRATLEQAAKELGQWVERVDDNPAGAPLVKVYANIDLSRV